jgi:hypothetical protein
MAGGDVGGWLGLYGLLGQKNSAHGDIVLSSLIILAFTKAPWSCLFSLAPYDEYILPDWSDGLMFSTHIMATVSHRVLSLLARFPGRESMEHGSIKGSA